MKNYNLAPFQSLAAKEGRLKRLIVPMKPQPFLRKGIWIFGKGENTTGMLGFYTKTQCGFSVGKAVGLREEWMVRTVTIDYKLERSWAIRRYFTPTEIQAKKVGELTDGDARECGIFPVEGIEKLHDYLEALKYAWTHQYRRRPALAWNEKLWVWSVAGKVEVI